MARHSVFSCKRLILLSPQGQGVGGCRESTPELPPLTAANLTLNAHLQINSCGFGEDREEEEEATKL